MSHRRPSGYTIGNLTSEVRPLSSLTMKQALWPGRSEHPALTWGRDAALVLAFSLLTALSAQIVIPLPFTPVPITGQTFGVLLTGALLGPRLGALSMLLYLAEGSIGLPFFQAGTGGAAILTSLLGGYLISYPFAAALTGYLASRGWDRRPATMLLAMLFGSLIIYIFGALQLAHFIGPHDAVTKGILPFLPGDGLKALLAAGLLPLGWKLLGKRER
jgi:biotin transport system substrate-specific component